MPRKPKTHCKRGHEFTKESVVISASSGKRQCKICVHMMDALRRRKRGVKPAWSDTYCRNGHLRTTESTYKTSTGKVYCRECKKESDHRSYIKHKEKRLQKMHEYSQRDEVKQKSRDKYKEKKKDPLFRKKRNDAVLKFSRTSKGKAWLRRNEANRRARILSTGEKFPDEQYSQLLEEYGGYCIYCKTYGHKLTVDHVIPLARGGSNSIDNLIPCCKPCNTSKNKKLPWEWDPDLKWMENWKGGYRLLEISSLSRI